MKKPTFRRITYRERVIIENRYCVDGISMRSIGLELRRPTSSISREVAGKPRKGMGRYRADVAQRKVDVRRHQQGRDAKCLYEPLLEYVVSKIKLGWSPEQISIRLPLEYPHDEGMRISYEAIYQYIYSQIHRDGHGYVKTGCEDLRIYLPRRHKRRQAKGIQKGSDTRTQKHIPSIDDRPEVVETRSRIGDWEDDLLVSGASNVCVKSANERMVVLYSLVEPETVQLLRETWSCLRS